MSGGMYDCRDGGMLCVTVSGLCDYVCCVHRQTHCEQVALEALMFTSLSAVTCPVSSTLVITAVVTFI